MPLPLFFSGMFKFAPLLVSSRNGFCCTLSLNFVYGCLRWFRACQRFLGCPADTAFAKLFAKLARAFLFCRASYLRGNAQDLTPSEGAIFLLSTLWCTASSFTLLGSKRSGSFRQSGSLGFLQKE